MTHPCSQDPKTLGLKTVPREANAYTWVLKTPEMCRLLPLPSWLAYGTKMKHICSTGPSSMHLFATIPKFSLLENTMQCWWRTFLLGLDKSDCPRQVSLRRSWGSRTLSCLSSLYEEFEDSQSGAWWQWTQANLAGQRAKPSVRSCSFEPWRCYKCRGSEAIAFGWNIWSGVVKVGQPILKLCLVETCASVSGSLKGVPFLDQWLASGCGLGLGTRSTLKQP